MSISPSPYLPETGRESAPSIAATNLSARQFGHGRMRAEDQGGPQRGPVVFARETLLPAAGRPGGADRIVRPFGGTADASADGLNPCARPAVDRTALPPVGTMPGGPERNMVSVPARQGEGLVFNAERRADGGR